MLISDAEKCLFMASNGQECAHMWYKTTPEKCDKLIKGWLQFQKDVSAYVPTEEAQKVTAESVMALPALAVQIKGEVTTSNLTVFVSAANAFLARIKTVLETDQDFADAEANVKACKAAEDGIEQTKKAITAQATSIDEVMRTMDLYKEKLSTVRLKLDKLVKSEKIARKEAIANKARQIFMQHYEKLECEIKPIRLMAQQPAFGEAMSGLKKLSAMQEAVDTMLRDSLFALDTTAADYRAKLAWVKENASGRNDLIHDFQALLLKPMEDFTLTITSRIEKQKADEAARMEAVRVQAEADALAKLEAEARAKAHPDQTSAYPTAPAGKHLEEVQSSLSKTADKIGVVLNHDLAPLPKPAESITIQASEYYQLRNDAFLLSCLRQAGVDNWEGWGSAMELFEQSNEMMGEKA